MSRTYYGYTRNRAKANLDALWATIAVLSCGGTDPIPLPDETAIMQPTYFGRSKFTRVCDLDALWAMLPGVQPAWPADHPTRIYRARASTKAYANLDALYAALRALDCCVDTPSTCRKILDADFTRYADAAAFHADWPAPDGDPAQLHRVSPDPNTYLDVAVSALGTRMTKKASTPDQTNAVVVSAHVFSFFSGVTPTSRAPVWMRLRGRLDTLNPTIVLNWGQQQLAFGGEVQSLAAVERSAWYAFAPNQPLGGPFQSAITCEVPTTDGNLGLGGEVDGFPWTDYYDGLSTEWEMVAHMQFNADGTARLRSFIGPTDGAKVPMSDVITYAPLMDHGELGWTYISHKSDGGLLSAPIMARAEAWECSYEANPCGVQLVLPSAAPIITSLTPVEFSILIDDELEIPMPVPTIARDANGVAYPGILPLILVDDLEDFTHWAQTVDSWDAPATGAARAVWPGLLAGGSGGTLADGAGVVSAPVVLNSFSQVARRYWFIRSDAGAPNPVLSLAKLELRETISGPDISALGTPIGSPALAGTSLANAFDGDGATFFTATGPNNEQFLGIDFGVGVTKLIREVALGARTDAPALAPAHFTICSSDDMALIARHAPYTCQVWTSGQALAFNVY